MDKLIKNGEQAFLCMIKPLKTCGITEIAKREQINQRGPKKDFAKVIDVIKQAMNQIPLEAKDGLNNLLKEYQDVFLDKLLAR